MFTYKLELYLHMQKYTIRAPDGGVVARCERESWAILIVDSLNL